MTKRILVAVALLLPTFALADASPVEVDAAVARMSSAAYKIEVLSACGYAKSPEEKKNVLGIAKLFALQKDGLSKKLSTAQFVDALLRTTDKDLVASMQERAKVEATESECAKPENHQLWDGLIEMHASLSKKK